MAYIILIVLIINTTITYATLLKKKFEETLVLTIVSYIVLLFLIGALGSLNIGFYTIILINILLLIYNINSIIKKKVSLGGQILTFGFIVFLITYILILWINIGRKSILWDEFSHWGLAVKNMFQLGNLGLGENSTILFKNYLSGTSIFQFFCTKLLGEFNEGMLYIGMNIMLISTIVPIFSTVKSRKNWSAYICYAIMFFIPTYFIPNTYITLYVDSLLALVFAYTLYSYFSNYSEGLSKFKIINLMASLIWLIFIKDFGLVLAVGSLFIILIDNLFVRNKFKVKSIWNNSKYLLLAAIPMVTIKIIWGLILKTNNVVSVTDTSNILPTILNFIKGDLLPYQIVTVKKYIIALFKIPLLAANMSYPFSFVIAICLAIILAYIAKRNTNDKKSINEMLILAIIGAVAYAILLMFVPFLSIFSEYEAVGLASYVRYMDEYILGLIFMELALIIKEISKNTKKLRNFTIIFLIIFITTFPIKYIGNITIRARKNVYNTVKERNNYNTFNRIVRENVKDNQKIYFIATNTEGKEFYTAKYEATPKKLSNIWNISNKPYFEGDIWTKIISPEEWKQDLIKNYDYVYLYIIDETFIENYGELFYNNIDTINNNQLYRVNKEETSKKILELVAE